VGKPMPLRTAAAIGLRYKFGTGPKRTGPDLEKNENRLYNENVN
jgi:hypothetical protein